MLLGNMPKQNDSVLAHCPWCYTANPVWECGAAKGTEDLARVHLIYSSSCEFSPPVVKLSLLLYLGRGMKLRSSCTSGYRRETWRSSSCTLRWPGRAGWIWSCRCAWWPYNPSLSFVRSLWRKQKRRVTELQEAASLLSPTQGWAVSVLAGQALCRPSPSHGI